MQDLIGTTLGHYRITAKIGEGGMGVVYRAHDERLDRDVAVKVLPEEVATDQDRLRRFEREAKAVAALSHPNILEIFDFDTEGDVTFAVTELLEGETLRERLEVGAVGWRKVAETGAAIAEGLAAAHGAGIIHRDLKPDNIFITSDGRVKILEFGLARDVEAAAPDETHSPTVSRYTDPGAVMGTAGYMSPEQVRGEPADQRSDLFSLGCVLYEMVSGRRAFARDTAAETMTAILREEPPEVSGSDVLLPPELEQTVRRCLEKRPEARFQSASDLAYNLRTISSASVPSATREQAAVRRRKPVLGAALLGLALTTTAVLWWQSQDKTREEAAVPIGATAPDRDASAPGSASIAVLPLENLGPAQEEFFADGMTDALITHLAKIEALKVISRISVMRYKDTELSLPEIARELGVETVLTGTVLHAGDRVRISTQLTDAGTDRTLWAESYEQDLGDILALQSEVARAIAEAVKVEVDPEEEARIATSRTVDLEAYEAFLRGIAELEKASGGGPGQRSGAGLVQQTVQIVASHDLTLFVKDEPN